MFYPKLPFLILNQSKNEQSEIHFLFYYAEFKAFKQIFLKATYCNEKAYSMLEFRLYLSFYQPWRKDKKEPKMLGQGYIS